MGRLYLDATGNYSNPAETSLKYLRADGQWATPDTDHKWLDAAGEYTVPELAHIYGVTFPGFPSITKGTRTGEAASFGDCHPAVANGTGDSPFDDVWPWSGMKVEERVGGKMVKIPKFYYRLTDKGTACPDIEISSGPKDGFSTSPAHMDRKDGKGERNAIYVGRYHCATGDYKSKTGVEPARYVSKSNTFSVIHNAWDSYYMMDFATVFTIWLLYLVEFAEWNSQNAIGYGAGLLRNQSQNMGYTDGMAYHTGTSLTDRTTYGLGTQYRYIEGLWENVRDILSGCRYSPINDFYIIITPSELGDNSGGNKVATLFSTDRGGYVGQLKVSNTGGFPIFYPSDTSGGSPTTGTCDTWGGGYNGTQYVHGVELGGYTHQDPGYGLFRIEGTHWNSGDTSHGCRLMELP